MEIDENSYILEFTDNGNKKHSRLYGYSEHDSVEQLGIKIENAENEHQARQISLIVPDQIFRYYKMSLGYVAEEMNYNDFDEATHFYAKLKLNRVKVIRYKKRHEV